ncbi:Aldehyde/histidinol dehydrogenase [Ilyonectria destructans]|nr:Aldehyde/histidinol dehydrogenase [Ilyonectria destructans]
MAANGNVHKLDFTAFSNIINGQTTETKSVRYGINPANKTALFPSPVSTRDDVTAAIRAARTAFGSWKRTPIELRKEKIQALSAGLLAHKTEFSRLLTTEQGKPVQFAEQEVDFAAYWLAGTCQLDLPEDVVEDTPERYVTTRYVPLGVVVGIVPWNFPLMLLCGKLAPAVMAGNCIIIKPSPFTPYCGIKLVELAQRFFPPGVIQVLSGDDNLGPWLTADPGIDKISFTGSTATGKRVMESASKNLTRVTLELGGNDAAIVCSDADVEVVAPQIAQAAFMNSGQICIAIKRVYVHKDIYNSFKDSFLKTLSSLKVGDGFQDGTFLGPVQNELQYDRVKEFLVDIQKNKQTVIAGGNIMESSGNGFFIQPTVVDNPPDESKIVVEEPFGPVVPLLQWSDVDEVIDRVNANDMGLGASVWTTNRGLAQQIAENLDVGSVWMNEHLGIQPTATFGGHKKSGIGREWGSDGLRGYCNSKTFFFKQTK